MAVPERPGAEALGHLPRSGPFGPAAVRLLAGTARDRFTVTAGVLLVASALAARAILPVGASRYFLLNLWTTVGIAAIATHDQLLAVLAPPAVWMAELVLAGSTSANPVLLVLWWLVAAVIHTWVTPDRLRARLLTGLATANREAAVGAPAAAARGVAATAVDVLGLPLAWVGVASGPVGPLLPVAVVGQDHGYVASLDLRPGQDALGFGPASRALLENHPVVVADIASDPLMAPWRAAALGQGFRSLLAVPLRSADAAVGVLVGYGPEPRWFSPRSVALAQTLADAAGFAFVEAQLHQTLEESYEQTVLALGAALEVRDVETQEHSLRVSRFAVRLATQLAVDPATERQVRLGAYLHDVGKIGVPDAVLHKPRHLTADEWQEVHRHPEIGHRLLAGIPALATAARVVLEHHERWDGRGYPQSLAGDQICLAARIFAVADTLDAMINRRPYRKALSLVAASQEIAAGAGTQFDPAVVAAFAAVPLAEWSLLAGPADGLPTTDATSHDGSPSAESAAT